MSAVATAATGGAPPAGTTTQVMPVAAGGAGGGGGGGRPAYFATGWTGGRNPWLIALVVTMATFMEILDTSIANVSLPHIAGSLSVSQDESTWVLTSYLVSNAVVLPISGWLANRIGRKRFYMSCVALFTLSSFLCGCAPTLGTLIFFRVLQGIGGGGLGPSEQSILADTFPPAKRGMAMAMYGLAVVFAPAIGPTLGGYITDHYDWRWVFFINIPVGCLSLTLVNRIVTDPPHLQELRKHRTSVDWTGLSLIAVGLGCFEVVLDKGQEENWFDSSFIIGFSIVAGVALTAFVLWELQTNYPIVDMRMFKNRTFASASFMMLMLGLTLFGSTVLLPQFLQIILGYSAQDSGMALSPGGFLIMGMMPMIGIMISRVDSRIMIAIGFSILASSMFFMSSHLSTQMDFKTAVLLRMFQSAGMAFLFVPINTLAYSGAPPEKTNQVSGIVNLSRNMGADIGIAFVTTMVVRRAQAHQSDLVKNTDLYSGAFNARIAGLTQAFQHAGSSASVAKERALRAVYGQVIGQATTLAYVDVLFMFAIACVCVLPLLLIVKAPRPGGAPMGGH